MSDTAVTGRPCGRPAKRSCPTAVSEAFALDTLSGADRSHWTAPTGGTRAAQTGSPVHTAGMTVLVLLGTAAGSRAVLAGSKAAVGAVK